MERKTVYIFSDGACSGNPGPGDTGLFYAVTVRKRSLRAEKLILPITEWSLAGSLRGWRP